MSFEIHQVDWDTHREALHSVRYEVFVVGQNVPAEYEVDSMDPAVLEPWRSRGVGQALMVVSLDCVSNLGLTTALLDSQLTASSFYEKLGFEQYGEEFVECGIPHIAMRKRIQ